MPTNKKILQVVMENEDYAKFQKLKKIQRRRGNSELAGLMIHDWLNLYEKKYGKLLEKSDDDDELRI